MLFSMIDSLWIVPPKHRSVNTHKVTVVRVLPIRDNPDIGSTGARIRVVAAAFG